jgi:protein TonB
LQRFYPEAARRQALTGVTHLTLQVDARGRVQSARVTSSQPAGVFDQAALRAAGVLRFEPARCNGQPMPADFQLTIHWQLDK